MASAFDDPGRLDLPALFRDRGMFDSRRAWSSAGFKVLDRPSDGKIMVAQHGAARGLLFKKYTDDVSQKDQLANFERRAEGAERLRSFVEGRGFRRVAIPRKWILELPRSTFRKERSHVLVVERMELLSEDQTKAAYRKIDADTLRELCVVLHRFRGMDSIAKNIPFVEGGRVAFIDTEHWDRSTSKSYLHRVGEYLSKDRRKLAKKIFGQLDDGDEPSAGFGDFDDEEDTSPSSDSSDDFDDDFDDEEDTSSSSMSS